MATGHPFWASLIEYIFVAHLPERLTDHRQIPMVSGPRGLTNFYLSREGGFQGIRCPARDAFHPDRTWFGLGHRGGQIAMGSHLLGLVARQIHAARHHQLPAPQAERVADLSCTRSR